MVRHPFPVSFSRLRKIAGSSPASIDVFFFIFFSTFCFLRFCSTTIRVNCGDGWHQENVEDMLSCSPNPPYVIRTDQCTSWKLYHVVRCMNAIRYLCWYWPRHHLSCAHCLNSTSLLLNFSADLRRRGRDRSIITIAGRDSIWHEQPVPDNWSVINEREKQYRSATFPHFCLPPTLWQSCCSLYGLRGTSHEPRHDDPDFWTFV